MPSACRVPAAYQSAASHRSKVDLIGAQYQFLNTTFTGYFRKGSAEDTPTRLQRAFIEAPGKTTILRTEAECSAQMARATREHVARQTPDHLYAVTMGRLVARAY